MDSDSDEGAKKSAKIDKSSPAANSRSKKRRVIDSSDDDENAAKAKRSLSSKIAKNSSEKKLKPVDVGNLFGDEPKRIEKERKPKKNKEKEMLNDGDDELMQVDESLLSPPAAKKETPKKRAKEEKGKEEKVKEAKPNGKEEKIREEKAKTPKEEKVKAPKKEDETHSHSNGKKENVKKEKRSPKKNSLSPPSDEPKPEVQTKKNGRTPSSNKKAAKKQPSDDHDESVYDDDQERFERKRAAAMLYKSFQSRAGPSNPGSKEIPKGKPSCLSGLTFVLTGVFESMEKDEAAQVIKDFGGRVTGSISGKTNYLVSGEDSGPKKLARAEELNVKIVSEDGLLDLIREKSGMPTKGVRSSDKTSAEEEKREVKVKAEPEVRVKKEKPEKSRSPAKKVKVEEPAIVKQEKASSTKADAAKEVSLAWVDKYKPKTIKEIIGQQGAASNVEKSVRKFG